MNFVLSKLLWTLTSPASLLLFAVAGAWMLQRRTPRLSRRLLSAAACFMILLSVAPVGAWSIATLERRFPPMSAAPAVDGIIVLGGALIARETALLGQPVLTDAAERVTTLVALAKTHPQARLLFSGGSGSVLEPDPREADQIASVVAAMGVDSSRLLLERDSRNTWENAVYTQRLIQPKPEEIWLLVTSAAHMPRAVGCFRAAGWNPRPYPVDFHASGSVEWRILDTLDQLILLTIAAKEWVGLIGYHLMQRTDAWFPAPIGVSR